MKQFIVTVKHDNGKCRIRTAATDKEKAIELIMIAEGCPRCAVISAREIIPRSTKVNKGNIADAIRQELSSRGVSDDWMKNHLIIG